MMESLESYFTFDTLVELLVKNLYYTKFQVNLIQRLKKKMKKKPVFFKIFRNWKKGKEKEKFKLYNWFTL